ncbi:hypothetical protein ACMYSO_07605 [Klebsiella sp. B345]|uniref:hypothetical protein n=1 Tax=Klebsiella sp. B345 TaxID=2755398 RepID=UPI003DA88165
MDVSRMKIRNLIIIFALFLSACSSEKKDNSTVEVCQGSVCHIQDKDTVTATTGRDEKQQSPDESYQQALRYFRGDGVGQDSYLAIKFLTRAAESGHHQAQKALGEIYLYGMEEMGSDPSQAARWLAAAAVDGSAETAELLKIARDEKRNEHEKYELNERRKYFYRFLYHTQWYSPPIIIRTY